MELSLTQIFNKILINIFIYHAFFICSMKSIYILVLHLYREIELEIFTNYLENISIKNKKNGLFFVLHYKYLSKLIYYISSYIFRSHVNL